MTTYLSPEQIHILGQILNYTFKDETLLNRVFEAASSFSTPEGNKRLALLGRSLLGFLLNLESVEQNLAVGTFSVDPSIPGSSGLNMFQ